MRISDWSSDVCSSDLRYAGLDPEQFAYSLLTRSQRISHENLRMRDAAWLEGYERQLADRAGASVAADARPPLPMLTPFRMRSIELKNRIETRRASCRGRVGQYV